MSRRRVFLVVGLLFLLAAVLAACAGATPTPERVVETVVVTKQVEKVVTKEVEKVVTQVVTKEVVKPKRVLVYNSYMGDPTPRQADIELVKMFQEKYPDVEVIHSIVAHEDFKQAIRAYLTSSSPPDALTWFAGNRLRFFVKRGLVMDISDMWQEQGWLEDYPKGFVELSSYEGRQYFVPTSWYWWAVYYRPSIFEKYGITPPKTWDELLSVCDTLRANGIIPFTIGTKYRWTAAGWFDYLNMRINGPEFHIRLMEGQERYDDPRMRQVFEHWKQLFDHQCFIENAAAYSWQEALAFMIQGKAAMYLMGDFIRDSFPDELENDLDFFQFPIINPDVPIGEEAPTDGYFIPANAPHPEEAKMFIAFVGSPEVQEYFARKLGRLATNSKVPISIYTPAQQKGIRMIQQADYITQFYDRDTTPPMADKGMNAFMKFWDNPDRIDEILAELEQARQEVFAEEQ
ncbi:MAG: carbohydrate ABC transporter substrate-binding protein [Chloroflexi bacterium]|nr:MAG: carbohydrate ABC transporter substrate-binding protein [Chloroflexota bacterium]